MFLPKCQCMYIRTNFKKTLFIYGFISVKRWKLKFGSQCYVLTKTIGPIKFLSSTFSSAFKISLPQPRKTITYWEIGLMRVSNRIATDFKDRALRGLPLMAYGLNVKAISKNLGLKILSVWIEKRLLNLITIYRSIKMKQIKKTSHYGWKNILGLLKEYSE